MTFNEKFEEELTSKFENWHDEFNKFWPEHSKISKMYPIMGSFWPKQKIYELKIYRGVTGHKNEKWCKILRGIDLSVQNWHDEFIEF